MQRGWTLGVLGVVIALGAARLFLLETRLAELERRPVADSHEVAALESALAELAVELDASSGELAERSSGFEDRFDELCTELNVNSARLAEHGSLLEIWESERDDLEVSGIEARIASLDRTLEDRWSSLSSLAQSAAGLARTNESKLDDLRTKIDRDHERMWNELVGPVVQLAGDTTVGSGILLRSVPDPEKEGAWITRLLTSWHVIRDIQSGLDNIEMPVPCSVYSRSGEVKHYTAKVLHFDAAIDAALLRLETEERLPCGAVLASRQELAQVRIFEPVYAVGCPLGNDPIPTYGEIAATEHLVDGDRYWMISAPTYVGNSGGGIFDAKSRVLLGVFSKIYTHGTLRPTVVPHMGLVTPLDVIYDWFDSVGEVGLIPPGPAQVAEAHH